MSRKPISIGDVFSVPIDEERVGFGQVVGSYKNEAHYFAVFETAYPSDVVATASEVLTDKLAFLALSFDAKLAAGHWKIIANAPVAEGLPLPAYKEAVGSPDVVHVVDYSGERRRRASADEEWMLRNRKFVAPVRLEKALRALHGVEPWQEMFDELRPSEDVTTQRFFG